MCSISFNIKVFKSQIINYLNKYINVNQSKVSALTSIHTLFYVSHDLSHESSHGWRSNGSIR